VFDWAFYDMRVPADIYRLRFIQACCPHIQKPIPLNEAYLW
jgi:hypothetical protein